MSRKRTCPRCGARSYGVTLCEAPNCGEIAAVGVGAPAVWLCIRHFERYLDDVKKNIKTVVEELQHG